MGRHLIWALLLPLALPVSGFAEGLPVCLPSDPKVNIESVMLANDINDRELLARLIYAEGLSTGFADDPLVYDAIGWGVMNRVRLGESSRSMQRAYGRGIPGVIFKKGQFNPAISRESPFSKAFRCPDDTGHWTMAKSAADRAMGGINNPFIETAWEKRNGLSLVVNFYYPQSMQAKGPHAPWEENKSLRFVGDILIDGKTLPAGCIRFYRLNIPPGDLKK